MPGLGKRKAATVSTSGRGLTFWWMQAWVNRTRGGTGFRTAFRPVLRPRWRRSLSRGPVRSAASGHTSPAQWRWSPPTRVNELKADAAGHWPPPFNFGGKPCLLIRTPDGQVRALQRRLHPRGVHGRVSPRPRPTSSAIATTACTTLNGRNVSGPPPRPLEEYKAVKGYGESRPGGRSLSPDNAEDRSPDKADAGSSASGLSSSSGLGLDSARPWPPRNACRSTAPRSSISWAGWPCSCSASRWPPASSWRSITSPRPTRPSRASARS